MTDNDLTLQKAIRQAMNVETRDAHDKMPIGGPETRRGSLDDDLAPYKESVGENVEELTRDEAPRDE